MFMKPNEAGSSFGVTKITDVAQIDAAIDHALTEGNEVLAESFISGREITCGVGRIGGKLITFPITEIVSKKEFFDYEAKYTTGLSEEITPAAISAEMTARCNKITRRYLYSTKLSWHCSHRLYYFERRILFPRNKHRTGNESK